MNLEELISIHKNKKIGNPISTVKIGDIDPDIFKNFKETILKNYNLTDEVYATTEYVFYETRRIVGKTPYIKTTEQKYSPLDFDKELLDLCSPIIEEIKRYLPNSNPTLLQLATILPGQKLKWHIDTYLYQQFSNKIHVPINTNPLATYEVFLEDRTYIKDHMSEGGIWNIDNLVLHRSVNLGPNPRTHLIIDFIDQDILDLLDQTNINYFHHNLPYMGDYSTKVFNILTETLNHIKQN